MPFSFVTCPRDHAFVAGTKKSDSACEKCPEGQGIAKDSHTDAKCTVNPTGVTDAPVTSTDGPADGQTQLTIDSGVFGGQDGLGDDALDKLLGVDPLAGAKQVQKKNAADLEELSAASKDVGAIAKAAEQALTKAIAAFDEAEQSLNECFRKPGNEALDCTGDAGECQTLCAAKEAAGEFLSKSVAIFDAEVKTAVAALEASKQCTLTFSNLDYDTEKPTESLLTTAIRDAIEQTVGKAAKDAIVGQIDMKRGSQTRRRQAAGIIFTVKFDAASQAAAVTAKHDPVVAKALELYQVKVEAVGSTGDAEGKSSNTGLIVAIVLILILVVAGVAGVFLWKQNNAAKSNLAQSSKPTIHNSEFKAPGGAVYESAPGPGGDAGFSNPNYGQGAGDAGQGTYEAVDGDNAANGVSNPNYGGVGAAGAAGVSNPSYGAVHRVETRTGTLDRQTKLVAGDEYTGAALVKDTYLDIAERPVNEQMYSVPMETDVPNRHYDQPHYDIVAEVGV
jgi:hypothetical protein